MSNMKIFQLNIFAGNLEELLTLINQRFEKTANHVSPLKIFTPNPEQIVFAHENIDFQATLRQADILIPDGSGLVWASKFLADLGGSKGIKQRITGIDLVKKMLELYP